MKEVQGIHGGQPIVVRGTTEGQNGVNGENITTFDFRDGNSDKGTSIQRTNANPFLDQPDKTKEDYKDLLGKYADNIAEDINEANSQIGIRYAKMQSDLLKAMRAIGKPDDPRYIAAQSYLDDLSQIKPKEFRFSKGKNEANYYVAKSQVTRYLNETMAKLDNITSESTFVTIMRAAEDVRAQVVADGNLTRGAVKEEGEATRKEVNEEGEETRKEVDEEGDATRRTVREEGRATREEVDAAGRVTRRTVRAVGIATRRAVRAEGIATRSTVRAEGEATRVNTQEEADRIISTLDPTGRARAQAWLRDQAREAGRNIGEFIRENPALLIPTLGIPISLGRALFE